MVLGQLGSFPVVFKFSNNMQMSAQTCNPFFLPFQGFVGMLAYILLIFEPVFVVNTF